MAHARVITNYDLGPEGIILVATVGADPAAGEELSITVPGSAVWDILSLQVTFAASASAANRVVRLVLSDGNTDIWFAGPDRVIPANQTWQMLWSPEMDHHSDIVTSIQTQPMPAIRALPGWVLSTQTVAIQAGDNFTAPVLLVRELPQRGLEVGQDALRSALRRLIGEEALRG